MDIGNSCQQKLSSYIEDEMVNNLIFLTEESTSVDIWFFVFESYINWVNSLGSFNMAPKQ